MEYQKLVMQKTDEVTEYTLFVLHFASSLGHGSVKIIEQIYVHTNVN